MEYTQEQLDQMLADAKKGLFTEEDLNKRVTAEVDRRVETGIQKGLETHKQKWEEEFSKKANMTAEEIAKQEIEKKLQGLSERESAINRRHNEIEAKSLLSEANIPRSHYENFIGILVTDDTEKTKSNVENFITMFNSTKSNIETELKSQFSNIPKPNQGGLGGTVTKADFDKMGYDAKLKFKSEHPQLYKEFMK